MKQMLIPSQAYVQPWTKGGYPMPKSRLIALGMDRRVVHEKFMPANPNFGHVISFDLTRGIDRTVYHFSVVPCYHQDFNIIPCYCAVVSNGKVISINKHLPYKGKCRE